MENPVYEVLETRGGTATPSPPTTSSNCSSSRTSCDLYSEIPPLSASGSPTRAPPPSTTTIPSLPSFYDVIRPHEEEGDDVVETSSTGEREEGEGKGEREEGEGKGEREEEGEGKGEGNDGRCSGEKAQGNVYDEQTGSKSRESNLYESVSDPFSSLDASGEYSTLERRRGYATLEPYTGTGGTLRLKQLGKKEEESGKGGAGEDEEYAHLNH